MSRLTAPQSFLNRNIGVTDAKLSQPGLPEWVLRLPGVTHVVSRLGLVEFRRRVFHMSPALIPIGLPFIPHADVWNPLLMSLLAIVTLAGLYMASQISSQVKREDHENWMAAVYGYSLPIVGALFLLPGRAELGLMTLQIVALGDGSATFGGLMLGGRRLPWNKKKTFSGLFCFVIVGAVAATYSYWGEANPVVPVGTAFVICLVSAIAAAIVESLPIRSNDNLRVGLTALSIGFLMTTLMT